MPKYRGQGIAKRILQDVIENYEIEYEKIYAHIWHTNVISVACMKKVGFEEIGRLETTKILHKCKNDSKGKLILMMKK